MNQYQIFKFLEFFQYLLMRQIFIISFLERILYSSQFSNCREIWWWKSKANKFNNFLHFFAPIKICICQFFLIPMHDIIFNIFFKFIMHEKIFHSSSLLNWNNNSSFYQFEKQIFTKNWLNNWINNTKKIIYFYATVRAVGIHVDGKAKTRWLVFLAPSAKRETRGGMQYNAASRHYHGFSKWILRPSPSTGEKFDRAIILHQ